MTEDVNQIQSGSKHRGAIYALGAAVLFGSSVPFAKVLAGDIHPFLSAGFLYLASGLGLSLLLAIKFFTSERPRLNVPREDLPWLAGSYLTGGILAPIALMFGLKWISGSTASLLLNLEGVFTALLAWFAFKENYSRSVVLGMGLIVLAGVILSAQGIGQASLLGILAIVGACLGWALDNNLTRKVSANDPMIIAAGKGLTAGVVNVAIGLFLGAHLPTSSKLGMISVVGFFGYGLSLMLFVLALRHVGTARTSAYFSTAPFVGAALSVLVLNEALSVSMLLAGALMAIGVWLHLRELHEHEHRHEPMEHEHPHVHDEHHPHSHLPTDPPGEPHVHRHRHEVLVHSHPHHPDLHHRHSH